MTRILENDICEKCNKPKEVYYVPWCPRCDKPKRKKLTTLNFVQCLDHLLAMKLIAEEEKYDFWSIICDNYNEFRNDNWFFWVVPNRESIYTDKELEVMCAPDSKKVKKWKNYYKVSDILAKTFKIRGGIAFHVSW